jgi:hypothetical protein
VLRATVRASNVTGSALAQLAWSGPSGVVGAAVADPAEPVDDTAQPSSAELLADAQRFRTDFGLNASATYIQSLDGRAELQPSRDQYGVSLDRYEQRRVELRGAISDHLAEIDAFGATIPTTYAGYYVDQDHGGLIYVGFTAGASNQLAELQRTFPYPEHLRTFAAARSSQSLEATQLQVEADADSGALQASGVAWTNDQIDTEKNKVLVGVEPTASATGTAATRSPQDILTSTYGSGVEATDPDPAAPVFDKSRTDYQDARGGLRLYARPKRETSHCTLGFLGTIQSPQSLQREAAFVTAGHCSPTSTYYPTPGGRDGIPSVRNEEEWRQGRHNLGYATESTVNTSIRGQQEVSGTGKDKADAVTISLARGPETGSLYWNNLNLAKIVNKAGGKGSDDKGSYVCTSLGQSNENKCGHVMSTSYTQPPETVDGLRRSRVRESRVVDFTCIPGDSGSPVVRPNQGGSYMRMRAIGMVSARTRKGYCVYTSIINIEEQAHFQTELAG